MESPNNCVVFSSALCRACMSQSSEMQSIFLGPTIMGKTLPETFTFVTGIKVEEDDGLPDQICSQCIILAESSMNFKRRCLQSDINFRTMKNDVINDNDYSIKKEHKVFHLNENDNSWSSNRDDLRDNVQDGDLTTFMDSSSTVSNDNFVSKALYQCNSCNHSFQNYNKLKEHIEKDHKEDLKQCKSNNEFDSSSFRYTCEICSKVFRTKKAHTMHYGRCEKSHMKKHKDKSIKEEIVSSDSDVPLNDNDHFESQNTQDSFCGDEINSNIFKDEIKTEQESIYEPKENPSELQEKSVKKMKTYFCEECNLTFGWKLFHSHMQNVHSQSISKTKKLKKKDVNGIIPTNGENQESLVVDDGCNMEISWPTDITFPCTMCERKFSKPKALALHMKRHETQLNEVHTCETCHREFKRRAHLENHMLTHSVDKGFKCSQCPKAFARQDSLSLHIANHKGVKKHQCNFCEKGFNMLSTLKDHIRTHTGEKPFLCSICGRGFSQSTNLKEHMRRHQGYKPFKCSFCDQTFVSKGELEAHSRKHSGAHPFVCDECGGGFTTSSSLVKHKRIHTGERPYHCDFCPMRFTALGTLKNHRRTHTGEKPYKCVFCEKAFAQKNDLVSHTRTHTGERPYVCSVCGHAFRQSSALKTHLKIHGSAMPNDMTGAPLDIPAIKVPEAMQIGIGFVSKVALEEGNSLINLMTPKSENSQQ